MTNEDIMKFSNNLKKYLDENKLTYKELSKKLGVPISTVHSWVNGVPPKNIKTMKEIALALNVSIDELCFDDKKEKHDSGHDTNLVITIGSESFKLILKKLK